MNSSPCNKLLKLKMKNAGLIIICLLLSALYSIPAVNADKTFVWSGKIWGGDLFTVDDIFGIERYYVGYKWFEGWEGSNVDAYQFEGTGGYAIDTATVYTGSQSLKLTAGSLSSGYSFIGREFNLQVADFYVSFAIYTVSSLNSFGACRVNVTIGSNVYTIYYYVSDSSYSDTSNTFYVRISSVYDTWHVYTANVRETLESKGVLAVGEQFTVNWVGFYQRSYSSVSYFDTPSQTIQISCATASYTAKLIDPSTGSELATAYDDDGDGLVTLDITSQLIPFDATIEVTLPSESTLKVYTFKFIDTVGFIDSGSYAKLYNSTGSLIATKKISMQTLEVSFNLTYNNQYTLTVNNTDGDTYTFTPIYADDMTYKTLTINPLDIPSNVKLAYRYCTAYAARLDSDTIQITWSDNQDTPTTSSVNVTILFRNETQAYSTVISSSNGQLDWNNADNETEYIVIITFQGGTFDGIYFKYVIGKYVEQSESPFDLSILGSFPIPTRQVIPLGIVLFTSAVFSSLSAPVGLFAMLIVTVLFNLWGWLNISWTILTIAVSLAVMYAVIFFRVRGF